MFWVSDFFLKDSHIAVLGSELSNVRNSAVYLKNSMLEVIDALQLSHKYVCVLTEGKKWPKSSTSTENICYVIDADLCRQI